MQEPERKKDLAELLKLVKKETDNCIRCGECRTVCPVFREDPKERYTARGKMAIAEELASGNLEFNGKVREAFENCLLCTGCASQCSSGARADKVILAVRRTFAKELGIPPIKKMIGKVLSQPGKILDLETKAGSLLQPLLFRSVPHESGLYRRFAMPMVDRQQYVPHIAETPFRNRNNFSGKPGQPVVMFYTGCMINYAMTEIGESLIKVLNALDISVSIPENQACCGTPMLTSGDGESVKNQAEKNIKAFCDGSDTPIVVACASCGHMLKHGYLEFLGKDPVLSKNLREKLKNISERTMDITEYLIGHVGEKKLKSIIKQDCTTTPFSVTYHDPCHPGSPGRHGP